MSRYAVPLAALVMVAALAGCAASPPSDGPSDSTTETSPPLAETALGSLALPEVLVSDRMGGAEPNLAVAADGTLYVSNPGELWRSDDDGASWNEVGAGLLDGGGDGDIALDAAGNVYWLGLFGSSGSIPFQVSHDRGATWSKAVDVSDGTGSDREWIAAASDGRLYTTWRGETGLEFRFSPDGGATWADKVTAAPDGNQGPVLHHGNRTYLAAADFGSPTGGDALLHVYTSDDDGLTWTAHVAADVPQSAAGETNGYITDFPVLAADSLGTLYLVYATNIGLSDGAEGPVLPGVASLFGIALVRSSDGGATWTEPLIVSNPSKDARMPWVAAGASGRVAIAWYENVNGIPGESLPDEWNVQMWHSITADQPVPVGATVRLTSTPNHLGALCTSGTGCLVSDRSLLDFFEVAITPDGRPVATWANSVLGTGLGVAAQGTDIYFGGIADAPPMR
ncbi:MAG: sialidase family protein [Candidatus Thermoplasmatota archaeon]|jgi:hypothetical protein